MLSTLGWIPQKQCLSQWWVGKLFWEMIPESGSGGLWRLTQERKERQHEGEFSSHSSRWARTRFRHDFLWSSGKWLREVSPSAPVAQWPKAVPRDDSTLTFHGCQGGCPRCPRGPGQKLEINHEVEQSAARCSVHGACCCISYWRKMQAECIWERQARWVPDPGRTFSFAQGSNQPTFI